MSIRLPQLGQLRALVVSKRTGTTAPHLGQLKWRPWAFCWALLRRPCICKASSATAAPRLKAGVLSLKSMERIWFLSLRSSTSLKLLPSWGSWGSSPWAAISCAS
jgi:hypothetical protein